MRAISPLIALLVCIQTAPARALDEAGASTFESAAKLYRPRQWRDDQIVVPRVVVPPPAIAPAPAPPGPRFEIKEFRTSGSTLIPPSRVDELLAPFVGPDKTLGDTQAARDALQREYEQEGFLSVAVAIPPQTVDAGIVHLEVIEARVGDVTIQNEGKHWFSDESVKALTPNIRPGAILLKQEVEEDLRRANRSPDRQVRPVVRAGADPGTVDVALQVEDRIPLHGSILLNNWRTPGSPHWRGIASLSYGNLWNLEHEATVSYQFSPFDNTGDIKIWGGSYRAPMPWSENQSLFAFAVSSDTANALVTSPGLNALGKATITGFRYQVSLPEIPGWTGFEHGVSMGLDNKDIKNALIAGQDQIVTPIQYVPGDLEYSFRAVGEQLYGSGQLGLVINRTGFASGAERDEFQENRGGVSSNSKVTGNFEVLTLTANQGVRARALLDVLGAGHLLSLNRPAGDFGEDWTVNLLGRAQWASEPLIAPEQLSAGGVSSVRGYLEGERFGDRGWSGQLELRTPNYSHFLGGRFLERVQGIAFFDMAELYTLSATGGRTDTAQLRGLGLGLRAGLFDHVSTELLASQPLDDTENSEKMRLHFRVSSGF